MNKTITNQSKTYEFEKVLNPFIKSKRFENNNTVMFCDCPICKEKNSMKVFLQREIAGCKKCRFTGTKDDFIYKLYLEKIK